MRLSQTAVLVTAPSLCIGSERRSLSLEVKP